MKAFMQSRGGEYWLSGVGGSVLMNEQHKAGLQITKRKGGALGYDSTDFGKNEKLRREGNHG